MKERILIIEDELGIAHMLELLMIKEGFMDVQIAGTGAEALQVLDSYNPDLIVLDVMLPDRNGFELCLELRTRTYAPILFLTARTADYDKLTGFAMGGDDYITKPFNALEVMARIKAQLARRRLYLQDKTPASYQFADFEMNKETGELCVRGEWVHCTAKEFSLLLFFVEHPGRLFNVAQLYEQVWGQMQLGDEKTVVIYISKIRSKIERDPKQPRYIVNFRGLGYKFVPRPPFDTEAAPAGKP
ncbi:transcriptional regulatory protein YvrH [Paenibacillus albidus]|uniref:Transcriptional regulatory protein YvrH n=1 Tax=Paenibacillus albidus TaxID=2041023 RepID=A0A917C485_9BACL|nr:response regulator transcription factor [Paenibacillus albidus]GGF71029.1 transcriptional regulatory protein YvrH [Paenibacillus albidus]